MSIYDDDTVDELIENQVDELVVADYACETGFDFAACSHRGRVRKKNEDQFLVTRRSRLEAVYASSLPDANEYATGEQHAWLLAVADGLGGHAHGELASATAMRTILSFANVLNSWIMLPSNGLLRDDLAERARRYADAIQNELASLATVDFDLVGMATTLTSAYVVGSKAFVMNIGDSRCYLIQSNTINQITVDHTVAQGLKDSGVSMEIANRFCNALTRSLSTKNDQVEIDLFQIQLQPDDYLLLCSDGLTGMVRDEQILQIIRSASSTRQACENLLAEALDQGGKDNVTIVLARV